jgi:VanZ family protein
MKKYLAWILPLVWALLIWRLTTTSQIVVTEEYLLQNILMMGAHFTFFGIQSALIYLLLPPYFVFSSNLAVVLTSLYGALVEFRQLSVPGRSADPMDWILDTLGAITFLLVLKKLQSRS